MPAVLRFQAEIDVSCQRWTLLQVGCDKRFPSPAEFPISSNLYSKLLFNQFWQTLISCAGQVIVTLKGHLSRIWSMQYNPSSELCLTGAVDGQLRVWDASTGKCIQILMQHHAELAGLCADWDRNLFVTASFDKTVRIW